jgi:hypothetical protein
VGGGQAGHLATGQAAGREAFGRVAEPRTVQTGLYAAAVVRPSRFSGPDQVAGCFLTGGGDPYRGELIQAQQSCQCSVSRASVLTRSPAGRCSLEGTTTRTGSRSR